MAILVLVSYKPVSYKKERVMSFFLKLNLGYDKMFLGSGASKENKNKETVALKRIFQVSKSSARSSSALLIVTDGATVPK